MTGVRIEVDDVALSGLFSRLAELGDDLTRPLDEIGAQLVANVLLRFDASAGPGGLPWKRSRRATKEGGKTLVDSGRLRQSITHSAGPRSVEVGTNVTYAAIHQFGGDIQQYAYSRKVAFRLVQSRSFDAGGNLVGSVTRRLFARTNGNKPHKRVERQAVTYGERLVRMPARPFLGLDQADRDDVTDILRGHVARIAGGGRA